MKQLLSVVSIFVLVLCALPAGAEVDGEPSPSGVSVLTSSVPVVPYLTVAVRELPPAPVWKPGDPVKEVPRLRTHPTEDLPIPPGGRDSLLDLQLNAPEASVLSFLSPSINIDGQGYTGVNPPDTVGDVGLNHYIQGINSSGGTALQIYDKNGAPIGGAFSLDSLGTGNCTNGFGDPIILYDEAADRWMLSEFASSGNQLCVYVSQTPDPTGTYYAYAFTSSNSFPDYPKYAVWHDAYYIGTNESSPTNYALDRNNMLIGAAATLQSFNATDLAGFGFQMLTPADIDGPTQPPAGSPAYFLRHRDTEAHGAGNCTNAASKDCLEIWEFSVNWATPANSSFQLAQTIEVEEFDSSLCGLTSFSCIDQPGSSTDLDPLREVTMWRNQYRNFGSHESLVGNFATDVSGSDDSGVRWFELRKTGAGPWVLFQEGTYAPDTDSRWMGSAAMDEAGNIAVGYNISSSSTYPGLRYAGRLAGDPLGTLPQSEGTIATGLSPNASNRYGDYAAMSVDPADGCTFWFTGMYNTSSQWRTQIAAMKFDACGTPDFTFAVAPTDQVICVGDNGLYDITIGSVSNFTDTVNLEAIGYPGTASFAPEMVTPPGTSTLTISSAPAGDHTFEVEGTSTTGTKTETVNLQVLDAVPAAPTPTAPADGATDLALRPVFEWTASGGDEFTIEVATDPGFVNVVFATTTAETTATPDVDLAVDTEHFWRVVATNPCGDSVASATFSFSTGNIACLYYGSVDVPKTIPSSGTSGSTTSVVNVPDSGPLLSITVTLEGTHTYMGDLEFDLQNPTGTSILIMDTGSCGTNENFDLTLDDDAASPFPCPPTGGGTYQPTNPLVPFEGEEVNGTWTLTIIDDAAFDSGTLQSWGLNICSVQASTNIDIFADGFEGGDTSQWSETFP